MTANKFQYVVERGLIILNLIPITLIAVNYFFPRQKLGFMLFVVTYSILEIFLAKYMNELSNSKSIMPRQLQYGYVTYIILSVIFYLLLVWVPTIKYSIFIVAMFTVAIFFDLIYINKVKSGRNTPH